MPLILCLAVSFGVYAVMKHLLPIVPAADINHSKPCLSCGKELNSSWRYCPFCNTSATQI